ncbi:MAG: glycoside hydrolase family 15 protein [Candidatus Gracilibacteria bacterium]
MKSKELHINDYSIIGDLLTVALIGKDGSIDWYCIPHINSPSVFAAMLDKDKGGNCTIQPSKKFKSRQKYIKNTNVLETHFKTQTGTFVLTDFMPVKHVEKPYENTFPTLIRKITCTKGKGEINLEFQPHFDYARSSMSFQKTDRGAVANNHKESLYIDTSIPLEVNSKGATGTINLKQGESVWVTLQYNDDRRLMEEQCQKALETTIAFWRSWINDCDVCQPESGLFTGPWKDVIIRSGLVLKLLIQDMTGAICAAATTSLPEHIGGERNWDYRFNWIRDAAFTVRALYKLGYVKEARKNLEWFMKICTENTAPEEIQIMYGLHGERDLEEQTLDHLSGYMNSQPVRIGNGAAKQKQLDIYGELVNAFYETSRFGIDISDREWKFLSKIVDYVCEVWNTKDAGIWEVRGGYQHFVHSKLMCWVALDRALKMADKHDKDCPREKWTTVRQQIHEDILEKGFNSKINSFVQAYESDIIDATCLLIPIYKFLPFDDPRIQGTLNAVLKKITTKEGLVYRYEHRTDDGLKGEEGAFLLCSFWLIDVLAYSGRIQEAKSLFFKMLECTSPTGLLAEEFDPKHNIALGNYPQAYSHIGLINSALYIEKAQKKGLDTNPKGEFKELATRLKNITKEARAKRRVKNF